MQQQSQNSTVGLPRPKLVKKAAPLKVYRRRGSLLLEMDAVDNAPAAESPARKRRRRTLERVEQDHVILEQMKSLLAVIRSARPTPPRVRDFFAPRPRCATASIVHTHRTDGSPPTRCLSAPSLTQEVGGIGELLTILRLSAREAQQKCCFGECK